MLFRSNFRHQAITRDDSKRWLDFAFEHDFATNGPSLYRMMRTMMAGWRRYKDDVDARVRARFANDASKLRNGYGAALWAMEHYLERTNADVSRRIRALRRDIELELGGFSAAIDRLVGPVLLWSARREAALYPAGRPLEPRTFVDRRNWR